MHKYEHEQDQTSVLLDGEKAAELKSIRLDYDREVEEACKELHATLNRLQHRFAEINYDVNERVESVLTDTALAGLASDEVSFDMTQYEAHGFIIARPARRLATIIDVLRAMAAGDVEALKSYGVAQPAAFNGIRADVITEPSADVRARFEEPVG